MQTENTFFVLAVSPGLSAEAGTIADVADREYIFGQNLVPVHRAEGVLGAGIEPQIVLLDFVGYFFGIEASAGFVRFGTQHGGRQNGSKRFGADIKPIFLYEPSDDLFVS